MRNGNVNEMLEPEDVDQKQQSSWKGIKEKLGPMEGLGASMAGASVPILAAPSETSKAKELVPEEVSVAGTDIDVHSLTEDLYNFKDEWIIGHSWETDNPLKEITLTADKLGHYSVGYLAAAGTQRAVDRMTGEYDPKKVALGGMMAVPIYAVAKEGLYEGGSGIQFNLESMDVWGDWMADTAGALHSVHNYHKKKTAAEGEEPKGLVRSTTNLAGRGYGRLEKGIEDLVEDVSEIKSEYSLQMPDIDMPELDLDYGKDQEDIETRSSSTGLSDLMSSSNTEEGSLDSTYGSDPLLETPDYSLRTELENVSEYSSNKMKDGLERVSGVKDSISSGISSLSSGLTKSSRNTGSAGSQSLDDVYG